MALSLQQLLDYQDADQELRFGTRPCDMADADKMDFVREQTLGLVAEAMEALDETGWKPWKSEGFGSIRAKTMALELADVFVFWANLCAAAGVGPEAIEHAILDVMQKNRQRFEEGY